MGEQEGCTVSSIVLLFNLIGHDIIYINYMLTLKSSYTTELLGVGTMSSIDFFLSWLSDKTLGWEVIVSAVKVHLQKS